ncbi:hypothetical protein B4088_1640 [Bacillus cereus]|uniref:Uncharacterized protein n=1 Tax=Bacillus cereus TaxID=1396 RepID=A0A164PVX5_BACCE|nr:hypothetical protein B4088_1640 [Bacillus cereus]
MGVVGGYKKCDKGLAGSAIILCFLLAFYMGSMFVANRK